MSGAGLGLQLYSVRDVVDKDFLGTMKKVKAIGYDYAELAGLCGLSPERVKQLLDEADVRAVSAHVSYADLIRDPVNIIRDYAHIGCKYIVIPYLTEDMRPGHEGFIALVSSLPKLGGICNDNGVKLLYHNHGYEFARMPDGRYALDYLFETVAPDLLQTELDTCWIKVMGESPVEYLKKYAGRCPVVHLKDFYLEGSLDGLFRLLGWAGESPNGSRLDVHFEYRPLGFGMQSIPEIINAASEAGAEFLIVEQDDSVGRSALEAVQMSYNYLRTLLN